MSRWLVVAPHPDDEVLGVGGTIARATAAGHEVHVAIVTRAAPPVFDADFVHRSRAEARAAHEVLGVATTHFFDFPAAGIDQVPHHEVNAALGKLVAELEPAKVFLPFGADLHLDHQRIFLSGLVATRPNQAFTPAAVFAYETLSETGFAPPNFGPSFSPNVLIDISEHVETKTQAMRCYESQLRTFPAERSIEAVRALATLRGATAGVAAAEAFLLVRQVVAGGEGL